MGQGALNGSFFLRRILGDVVSTTKSHGVSPQSTSTVCAFPNPAEVRAAVRSDLIRRIRDVEAKAEQQQRRQQEQQRQQLQQLAESLRTVERDVEAVQKALATENAVGGPPPTAFGSPRLAGNPSRAFSLVLPRGPQGGQQSNEVYKWNLEVGDYWFSAALLIAL